MRLNADNITRVTINDSFGMGSFIVTQYTAIGIRKMKNTKEFPSKQEKFWTVVIHTPDFSFYNLCFEEEKEANETFEQLLKTVKELNESAKTR